MPQSNTGLGNKVTGDLFSATEFNTLKNTIDNNSTDAESRLTAAEAKLLDSTIVVKTASQLSGVLDSTKVYVIDGIIDMGSQSIEVPAGGLSLRGTSFDVSQLTSSATSYTMFTSPVGGSGNLVMLNLGLTASGTSSSIFGLTDATGFNALEIKTVNFNGCTSLGYIDGYRQVLEEGTGRFGGTPELELRNPWVGGYRITTSIVRGLNNITSLFKAGSGFTMGGRFITDINCDLPAVGALIDFAPSNITNDESLILSGCYITRSGVIDTSDPNHSPNIDHTSVKSLWSNNTGITETVKTGRLSVTAEAATTINTISVFEVVAGTFTLGLESHFDSPSNGELRLLSGNGSYQISGDLVIEGPPNEVLALRITKSTDGGVTWPTVIGTLRRQVLSLVGGRDVAFVPVNVLTSLEANDRLRLEVANDTTTGNVTLELDSYIIATRA